MKEGMDPKKMPMLSGFNHNIKFRGKVFHVQTEDGGRENPQIVTHVFLGGVIVDSVSFLALRWAPIAAFDATLSYAFQNAEYGGRTISGRRGLLATGDYVSPLRVREPNQRDNSLIALEAQYDVGWGTLSSATGSSRYEERGQRDQTDLLIGLEYSYELFPSFTAYTLEHAETSILTQELRFVWIWMVR